MTVILMTIGCMTITWANHNPPTYFEDFDQGNIGVDTVPSGFLEPYLNSEAPTNPFDLRTPSVIQNEIEYDANHGQYNFSQKLGQGYLSTPNTMTFSEYLDYKSEQQKKQYYDVLSGRQNRRFLGQSSEPLELQEPAINLIETLFGSDKISFDPRGQVGVFLGYYHNKTENATLTERQQANGYLDFDMDMRLNLEGQVGEKLNMSINYDPKATFDFDRVIKLSYDSKSFNDFGDDDIIKGIEAGNVSMPLNNSLIQGSESLFGLKLTTQFGKLRLTTLIAEQQTDSRNTSVTGGALEYEFEINAFDYDPYRHYFLAHYFREIFDTSLVALPQILSQVRVTRLEVWVTNDNNNIQRSRQVIGFGDLGEGNEANIMNTSGQVQIQNPIVDDRGFILPGNEANTLYNNLAADVSIRNQQNSASFFEGKFEYSEYQPTDARLLSPSEYTLNPELGFISLRRPLDPDQALAVAYEYEYKGRKFQVGELSTDLSPNGSIDTINYVLITKLLRKNSDDVGLKYWELMMKNFYHLQAYNLSQEDFELDVYYDLPGTIPSRYIPEEFALPNTDFREIPLLSLLRLDRINRTGDPQPDGEFDFVSGLTMNPSTGIMMFPVLEPFGDFLRQSGYSDTVVYDDLYLSSPADASSEQDKSRFIIKGEYKSSNGNIIPLNSFNIPQGSIRVTAGGRELVEGTDYRVDYGAGYVEILNEAYLGPSTPININFEDQSAFGLNRKTMLGLRADYEIDQNFNLGVTFLNLYERPYTQKVDIGNDPINNWMYGVDMSLTREAPFLNRFLDKVPLLRTRGESRIDVRAEGALLRPGHSKTINNDDDGGIVMLDDFEGSSFGSDVRSAVYNWKLASLPDNNSIDGGNRQGLEAGFNRASLSWYTIETALYERLDDNDPLVVNPYTRPVEIQDVYPNRDLDLTQRNYLRTMDLHFDPTKRGPYNFDRIGGQAGVSAGIDFDTDPLTEEERIFLLDPASRWAGIQKNLTTNNFEQANYESIEFWMLDPFLDVPIDEDHQTNTTGGKLYINLGTFSEDILPDDRQSFENGLPTTSDMSRQVDTTIWGAVPDSRNITRAWDADAGTRIQQDVGYDGLNDEAERGFFQEYVNHLGQFADLVEDDPANDNYYSFRAPEFEAMATNPIIRYERYNYPQGNSEISDGSEILSATNDPDNEDLNNDNTLIRNDQESYFEYEIDLRPGIGGQAVDNKYIVDMVENTTGEGQTERWYLFRIPLDRPDKRVGSLSESLRFVQFMRMYMTDFEQPVTMRFASLELIRNSWRQYDRSISTSSTGGNTTGEEGTLNVTNVNIEENSRKEDFNYVLPPGIQREELTPGFNATQQNEQSLLMSFSGLQEGSGLGIFKNLGAIDLRDFERLKMFVHLEETTTPIEDTAISMFIRIGDDFTSNYYEIEQGLKVSRVDSIEGIMRADPRYKDVVWPAENIIEVNLSDFTNLKKEREIRQDLAHGAFFELPVPIKNTDRTAKVKVLGNPSLGSPKSIMIGFYNTSDVGGGELDGEIWVNELSLSGLNEQGGGAAVASVDIQLADFGRVTLSGNYSSIGFGAIGDKVVQRTREELIEYDISTNFEIGNFFPENWGLQIPFYYQYSKATSTPKYDAVYEDLLLEDVYEIADADSVLTRDEVKDRSQTKRTRSSLGFTNVNINPQSDKPPKPWSVSNFRVSYEQAEVNETDPNIEEDKTTQRKGNLDYDYNIPARYVEPFKKVGPDSKFLGFFNKFNFNPVPSSFSFSTQLFRERNTRKYRNTPDNSQNTWVTKRFTWDRNYNLNWDLAKSLKLRFNAVNEAVIDELNENPADYDPNFVFDENANQDMIREGLREFGRTKNYSHNADLSYVVPFQYFPYLDFIKARASVRATYAWSAAPDYSLSALEAFGDLLDIGNTIQNSQDRRLNLSLDFKKLYNNVGYLKRIDSYRKSSSNSNSNRRPSSREDSDDSEEPKISAVEYALVRPLMMIRSFDFNYTHTFSSTVPGYFGQTNLFGLSSDWQNPGWKYIIGFQPDEEFYLDLNEQGLIRNAQFINQELTRSERQDYDLQLTLEPYKNLQITIDAYKNISQNEYEGFDTSLVNNEILYTPWSPRSQGGMEVSILSFRTLFGYDINELFSDFDHNRVIIRDRYNDEEFVGIPDSLRVDGFGDKNKDVLVPAFLAAYLGQDANDIDLETFGVDFPVSTKGLFNYLPRPNWNLNFTGLQEISFFKERLRSLTIKHGYRSRLSVSSYFTDRDFISYDVDSLANRRKVPSGSFYSQYEIPNIVIDESFNPLIGFSLQTKNRMTISLDYIKTRRLAFSLSNDQLDENKETRVNMEFGYTIEDVFIGFLQSGKQRALYKRRKLEEQRKERARSQDPADNPRDGGDKQRAQNLGSDLTIGLGLSWSDRERFVHILDAEGNATYTPGSTRMLTITPVASYKITDNLSTRFEGSYSTNDPYLTGAGAGFRSVTYSFGFGIQYVLN